MEEELKETKRSSKEMWLFLIFLDIIVLCVFGYFIYSSFFAGAAKSAAAEPFMEEVAVEDIIVEEPVITPKAPPKEDIVKPQPAEQPAEVKKEEPKKEEPKKEEVKKEEPKKEAAKPAAKSAAKKRQSVFIRNTGKPTREVIFKYYSTAKNVAVIGGFTMRQPVRMKKLKADEWSAVMRVFPGEYRYMLVVDGKEITDPYADVKDGKSVLIVK